MERSEGGLGKINIPLLSDLTHEISRDYGVLLEDLGHTLRYVTTTLCADIDVRIEYYRDGFISEIVELTHGIHQTRSLKQILNTHHRWRKNEHLCTL